LRARWKSRAKSESGLTSDSLEYWEALFNYIRQSDFLMGNSTGRTFQATFDWIIKESNFSKILEGNYHK
jgi:hypothetical protein